MLLKQLLMPRYEVVSGYPGSKFEVGSVITLDRNHLGIPSIESYSGTDYTEEYLDTFPKVFKKLFWYENRQLEEMPEFIKVNGGTGREYHQVKKWVWDIFKKHPIPSNESNVNISWYFFKKHSTPIRSSEFYKATNQN